MSPRVERPETSPGGEGKLSITVPPHHQLESTAAGYQFTFTGDDVGEWLESLLSQVRIEKDSSTYEQTVEVVTGWIRSYPKSDDDDSGSQEDIVLFLSHDEAELVKGEDRDIQIRFINQEAINATALALLPELPVDLEEEPRIFEQICAQLGLAEEPRIKEAVSLVPIIAIEAALNIKAGSDDNATTRLQRVLDEVALLQEAGDELGPLEEAFGLSPSPDDSAGERIKAITVDIESRLSTQVSKAINAVLDALEIRPSNLTPQQEMGIDDNLQAQGLPRVVRVARK